MAILTKVILQSLLVAAATATALEPRAPCGETAGKVCYGVDGGTSQNLDPDDIAYVATYLRFLGTNNTGSDKFWTMPPSVDCQEWTLPVTNAGTVLALAKHINPRINSSILYTDLANTIDGGENASATDKAKSLTGCDKNGGQLGVIVDANALEYKTPEYIASKAKHEGIIIKLVRDPKAS
ncbi:hypothetical protein LEL_07838 [Akanthomyces lecanii RCEF 1005]|uniref:Uncharacterized protein n=1 Tax=Akanthomyces lecanii RCEF 1005 TaxID=1081108 RepID=A0A168EUX7_CORDF|nr:hypothetical protein LEL_07838 [Akanthomyces lecanii RCEF 1005]